MIPCSQKKGFGHDPSVFHEMTSHHSGIFHFDRLLLITSCSRLSLSLKDLSLLLKLHEIDAQATSVRNTNVISTCDYWKH